MTINRKKMTFRAAIVTALVVGAVPAGAAVLVSNFMKANATRGNACIVKIAGADNAPSIVTSDVNNVKSVNGVNLLNETITVHAYAGDRTVATDGIRIKNVCAAPLKVWLHAEKGISTAITEGNWVDLGMKVYLGKQGIVTATPLNSALASPDFADTASWDQAPLVVSSATAAGNEVVSNATSGTITVAPGQEIQLGVVADAGSSAQTGQGTLNYTVYSTQ